MLSKKLADKKTKLKACENLTQP